MIRVLFVLPNLQGGGAERVVLDLVRHLDRRTFRPVLFLLKDAGPLRTEVPDDVPVRTGPRQGRLRRHLISIMGALLQEARSSHVVVGALELHATYASLLAARLARRPVIAWVHTVLSRFLDRKGNAAGRAVARAVYPRLPLVVVPSAGAAADLQASLAVDPHRIVEIPNVVDLDRVRHRAEEPLPSWLDGSAVVVAVGRLEEQKGFDVLMTAHALLRRRGLRHRLVVLGEGPERAGLTALAARLGVADSVVLPGFVTNPYPIMKAATVFALSSRYEGFSLVLLEALGLGIPVVASDCPSGPREILEGGRWGRLVPPEDPNALAEALGDVLSGRQEDGSTGVRRAEQFTPEKVLPRWEELLVRLAQ